MGSNPFDYTLVRIMSKKRWVNRSGFCNSRTHPILVPYRRYRLGVNRCVECGARLGPVKCVFKSPEDELRDIMYEPIPMLLALKEPSLAHP